MLFHKHKLNITSSNINSSLSREATGQKSRHILKAATIKMVENKDALLFCPKHKHIISLFNNNTSAIHKA